MAPAQCKLLIGMAAAAIIGRGKAWTYVAWAALFSTLAGLLYGSWVDGVALGWIVLALGALLAVLAAALWLINWRNAHRPVELSAS